MLNQYNDLIYELRSIKSFCLKLSFIIFIIFFLFSTPLWAQQQVRGKTVNGTVKSVDGVELIGANIRISGTTTGTHSDEHGKFSLALPSLEDTLEVSYIGYITKYVPVNGRTYIEISLKSKDFTGKEVVITAFGEKQAKESLVGSVTSLDEHQLNVLKSAPTGNLTTVLSGRIPGVIAFQRSGEPGNNTAQFFIRGVQSFGYGSSPLILIDGVRASGEDLALLNPNDIESFSVLSDATATSLYGSKAANGVMIIKTKTGKAGHIRTTLRVSNNITMSTQVPEFADPVTYMKEANNATRSRNPLAPLPYDQLKIDKTQEGTNNPFLYPAVDWYKMLFKGYAYNQMYSLNINGGGEIATYYISGSMNKETGLLKVPHLNNFNNNINVKNYSLRSNIDINLTKSTFLAFKINGVFQDYQGPLIGGTGTYHLIVNANPVRFPAFYPIDSAHAGVDHPLFGNYVAAGNPNSTDYYTNPYAEMVKGYQTRHQSTINAQFEIKQDLGELTKGLDIGGLVNVQRFSQRGANRSYNPYYYQAFRRSANNVGEKDKYYLQLLNPETGNNHLSFDPQNKIIESRILARAMINYKRTFGDGHGVSAFIVLKARNEIHDESVTGTDLEATLPYHNVNWAGKVSYNYKHRYYAEANLGITGSERFAKGHRYGFFPSFGVKYNISNEKFWESIEPVVSNMAVRLTFGYGGNDDFSTAGQRFLYLSKVNFDAPGYTTGVKRSTTISGIDVEKYPNPYIGWERKRQTNIGIDLGFIQNSLTIHTDLYHAIRSNILQQRISVTYAMGLQSNPLVSYGQTENKGVSTRLVFNKKFGKMWSLNIRGNFTYAQSEIKKYSENPIPNSPNVRRTGTPVNEIFGLYADRLFLDEKEVANSPEQNFGPYGAGDLKYRDINGDGKITLNDVLPIGYPTTPEINYGFGFSLQFKQFDLSSFFVGLAHESFMINTNASNLLDNQGTAPFVGGHQLLQVYEDDHWTPENRNVYALYPHFSSDRADEGVENNSMGSTWFLRNGAYLRLKRVEVGYTLPTKAINSIGLNSVRCYASGVNLFHFSKFKLWDPEMAGNGLGYPLQTTYNLGVLINF